MTDSTADVKRHGYIPEVGASWKLSWVWLERERERDRCVVAVEDIVVERSRIAIVEDTRATEPQRARSVRCLAAKAVGEYEKSARHGQKERKLCEPQFRSALVFLSFSILLELFPSLRDASGVALAVYVYIYTNILYTIHIYKPRRMCFPRATVDAWVRSRATHSATSY